MWQNSEAFLYVTLRGEKKYWCVGAQHTAKCPPVHRTAPSQQTTQHRIANHGEVENLV